MALDTDRLAELVAQKYQLLQSVQELVLRQGELIHKGEMTALLEVLGVKQRLLEEIQAVEQQLAPFRQQAPQSRRWRNELLRQQTAALVERCQQLLAEILQQEKHCETQLLRRREQIVGEMRNLCTSGQMLLAYQAAEPAPQSELDLVSEQ
ncbi:MAG: hypothetical protein RMI90_04340 [Thermoguttaceae bacterium]|nr:hypothetical protein [Thermoguttaceae bacterium]